MHVLNGHDKSLIEPSRADREELSLIDGLVSSVWCDRTSFLTLWLGLKVQGLKGVRDEGGRAKPGFERGRSRLRLTVLQDYLVFVENEFLKFEFDWVKFTRNLTLQQLLIFELVLNFNEFKVVFGALQQMLLRLKSMLWLCKVTQNLTFAYLLIFEHIDFWNLIIFVLRWHSCLDLWSLPKIWHA